jgi:SprT-like family protein
MSEFASPAAPQPLAAFQSSLFFETPEQIYLRVFRELKPRTKPPEIKVEYRRYANADSSIRLEDGRLIVRISDVLEGAPAPIQEALAYILLGKLYRREVPRAYPHRYRLYLNRRDMRRQLHLVRQIRGRKFLSGPEGQHHDLDTIFDQLSEKYFQGLLGKPRLGWSRTASRSLLGHYDPSHNAIIISRIFDNAKAPKLALEYVMFHEMLHLRYPVEHQRSRRRVHTREFLAAERAFERLPEAKELLKGL